AILARLITKEETPAKSPWWLTLLRLLLAAFVIFAMSGPVLNPEEARLQGDGPVVVVMDNGWASGRDWDDRKQAARTLIEEAGESGRSVVLLLTAGLQAESFNAVAADTALAVLEGVDSLPQKPDHARAASVLRQIILEDGPGSVVFLADGLDRPGSEELVSAISAVDGQHIVQLPGNENLSIIDQVRNDPDALIGSIVRLPDSSSSLVEVTAFDNKGLTIARNRVDLPANETRTEFRFSEPVELRNQIVRITVEDARNAGAVQLLDESYRRRLVGLISGETADLAQPLLSPLYYIGKALSPFSDVREAGDANVAAAVPDLIGQGVSALVLADIGNLPEEASDALGAWVENGGMLIRFAGPRLAAASDDDLLPVRLRRGDRNLGGALSWETPKPVAPFENGSPFFGLEPPSEVVVERQVLALQDIELQQRTWAILEDGTPLVTAAKRGAGWIVLFHVSSDAAWSNLPISGTFVEMLRRVVNQSRSTGANSGSTEDIRLPPLSLLNGQGAFVPPGPEAAPLVLSEGVVPTVKAENPPGLYGTEDGFTALNLFTGGETLVRLDETSFGEAEIVNGYGIQEAFRLKPWLLAAAAVLLLLDCLAVLWISGSLRPLRGLARGAGAVLIITSLALVSADTASAQGETVDEEGNDFSSTLATRLAYVMTGVSEIDAISEAGLTGLTRYISSRTALEPAAPIGLDLSQDELAFYPLIYWPISVDAELPDAATMARVDAFMKQGGSILFDTRDQISGILGGTASSPEAQRLQIILSGLDIPPLEPVPPDHVLTKAFYLLSSFPGRFAGGDLWVEAIGEDEGEADRPARSGDGVSSILITSNDMAGAWAVDELLRPMFATIPPDPSQREMSFRTGVNLIMYAMTGNYKADQVHIPALLERLGQ
ncbi:MAG: DUF4159 domain-containing protein, partial [Pseudomonadota bacterium]